jgi:hypothetical protein
MRSLLLAVVFALVGGWMAVRELRGVLRGEPLTMSCAEFARERPEETWLRLTDCRVDVLGAVSVSSRVRGFLNRAAAASAKKAGPDDVPEAPETEETEDKAENKAERLTETLEVFLPVRPAHDAADEELNGEAAIVLRVKDAELRRAIDLLSRFDPAQKGGSTEVLAQTQAVLMKWSLPPKLEGVVDLGSKRTRKALKAFGDEVAPNAVVLDQGKRPAAMAGAFYGLLSLGSAAFLFVRFRRGFQAPTPAPEGVSLELGQLASVRDSAGSIDAKPAA